MMKSKAPRPKIVNAGMAGAIATLIVFFAEVAGLDVPAEVAGALATLLAVGAGYLTPED